VTSGARLTVNRTPCSHGESEAGRTTFPPLSSRPHVGAGAAPRMGGRLFLLVARPAAYWQPRSPGAFSPIGKWGTVRIDASLGEWGKTTRPEPGGRRRASRGHLHASAKPQNRPLPGPRRAIQPAFPCDNYREMGQAAAGSSGSRGIGKTGKPTREMGQVFSGDGTSRLGKWGKNCESHSGNGASDGQGIRGFHA